MEQDGSHVILTVGVSLTRAGQLGSEVAYSYLGGFSWLSVGCFGNPQVDNGLNWDGALGRERKDRLIENSGSKTWRTQLLIASRR